MANKKAKRYKMDDKLRVSMTKADLKLIKFAATCQRTSVSQFVRESSIAAAILVANTPTPDGHTKHIIPDGGAA